MLKAGTIIGERYEIVGRIGSGGMADVYKAKDHKLNRFVAVKVLKQEFREDANFIRKFRTEAQAAAGLAHPNIVNVYDVGEDHGVHFIVMELVEGITLKEYINKKGRMSVREATSIAIQVSMGLEAAHAHNIVHRDVKPQNIIISTDGKVKVTDFGIARAASSNTISSNVMGSVHYSSPEQVRGGYSDAKSDIYSLGITMYEMVTGRIPFDGDTTVAIAIKHLQDEMEPPSTYAPNLPHSLEQIIYKCTQKSVDRRYNNMTEVIADLKRSLIEPEGDFVKLLPLNNHAQTVMLTKEDLEAIQQGAAEGRAQKNYQTIDEDAYLRNQRKETPKTQYEDEDEDDDYEDDDYDDDDEGGISSKLEKALTIGGFVIGAIIICVIIFFIGQAAGIFHFGSGSRNNAQQEETVDNQVEVPNLLGMTQDQATAAANEKGLGISYIGEEASSEYPKGQIIRQSEEAGTKVDPNTTIEITISSGPAAALTVPAVTNMPQADAEAAITALGLVSSVTTASSEDVTAGNVISVDPAEGTEVEAGATIALVVSTGPEPEEETPTTNTDEMITVPDVRGMEETEAKEFLNGRGFVVKATSGTSDRVNEGDVISQSLEPDSEVASGSVITLTINGTPTITDDAGSGSTSGGSSSTGSSTTATATNWVCNSKLEAPGNYAGGPVKLELVQTVNGEEVTTTIVDGETLSFPYVLKTSGAEGVATGTVNMYELVNNSYVARANYGPVKFSEAN
ncbi:MAG: Stk1 family PASTA domain-containing Ser/Thr kinase [Lachnospiraceae bacterium]|nr:Stk1 family PASTA domain-containing Ser/Thr kinase [Lachnospiraceae bacterium]MDD3617124.1 Stk1 family PASTA domain-containing Ser/Thr kinase [Lachnospiraceae bacterium]